MKCDNQHTHALVHELSLCVRNNINQTTDSSAIDKDLKRAGRVRRRELISGMFTECEAKYV